MSSILRTLKRAALRTRWAPLIRNLPPLDDHLERIIFPLLYLVGGTAYELEVRLRLLADKLGQKERSWRLGGALDWLKEERKVTDAEYQILHKAIHARNKSIHLDLQEALRAEDYQPSCIVLDIGNPRKAVNGRDSDSALGNVLDSGPALQRYFKIMREGIYVLDQLNRRLAE